LDVGNWATLYRSRSTVRWHFPASHERLDAFFKIAARQQNAMLARLAHDPNIRAQTHDLPFVSAARMRLAQTHYIAQANFQRHRAGIINESVN